MNYKPLPWRRVSHFPSPYSQIANGFHIELSLDKLFRMSVHPNLHVNQNILDYAKEHVSMMRIISPAKSACGGTPGVT
jgi:hypothetical protein